MPRGQSAKTNPRELHREIETTRALSHCSTNQSIVTQTHTATGNKARTKQKQIFDKQYTTRKCKEIQLKPTAIIFFGKQAVDNE